MAGIDGVGGQSFFPRSYGAKSAYRNFPTGVRLAYDGGKGPKGGDRLKALQNDLFHGGYYGPGVKYKKAVDGRFDGETAQAVAKLQQDLTAAGVYRGPINGQLDDSVTDAISRFQATGTPGNNSLSRFLLSSSQKPSKELQGLTPQMFDQSTYTPYNQGPVSLGGQPGQNGDVGEQRIANTIRALATQADPRLMQSGNIVDAERALAQVAEAIAAHPDSREILSRIGAESLGFNPMNNSEEAVDQFLNGIKEDLIAKADLNQYQQMTGQVPQQGFPQQGFPQQQFPQQGFPQQQFPQQQFPQQFPQQGIPQQFPQQGFPQQFPQQGFPQPGVFGPGQQYMNQGDQRIASMIRVLAGAVDFQKLGPNPTNADMARAMADVANQLKKLPNTRAMLSVVGAQNLGFDPNHNSEKEIDKFLSAMRTHLLDVARA